MRGKFTSGLASERGSARDLTIVEVAKDGCTRTHSDQNEIYSTFPHCVHTKTALKLLPVSL